MAFSACIERDPSAIVSPGPGPSGDVKKIDLPAGGTSGYAVGINDRGQVIGTFQ